MLAVAKLALGRESYYLGAVEAAARTSDGGASPGLIEPDGCWLGAGSELLGIAGRVVAAEEIRAVLAGADPRSGEPLDARHSRVRVAAYDCTFAPAKSVSLLHALGPPDVAEQVRAGHEAAVHDVLGYLDRNGAHVRRSVAGTSEVQPARGLVAASFVHRTSRRNEPHLHTHLVVANLAQDRVGRWSALDGRAIYLHASTTNLLYALALRRELDRRLGVRFSSSGPYADIAGVDRRVVEAFSTRSRDIAEELEHFDARRRGAGGWAAARSRPAKDLATPYTQLVEGWWERAHRLGISEARIARLAPGPARPRARGLGGPDGGGAGRRGTPGPTRPSLVSGDLSVPGGAFTRRDLIRAACEQALGEGRVPLPAPQGARAGRVAADLEALADSVLAAPGVVALATRPVAHLHGRGGRLIPAGLHEQAYATVEWLELASRADAAVAATAAAFSRGVGRAGPASILESVADWYRRAASSGRPVAAIAPSPRLAAQFEGLTGIPSSAPAEGVGAGRVPPPETCLVVAGVGDLAPDALRWLLELGESARCRVDFLAASALEELVAHQASDLETSRASCRHLRAGAVAVVVAEGPGRLLGEIAARLEQSRSAGGMAAVVVADRRVARALATGLGPLGPESVVAMDGLARLIRPGPRSPDARASLRELLVLGPAGMLSPLLDEMDDARRTHFVVEATASSRRRVDERGWLAAIALPRHLREVLGPPPCLLAARGAWQSAAARVEGFRDRNGIVDLADAYGAPPASPSQARDLLATRAGVRGALAGAGIGRGRPAENRTPAAASPCRDARASAPQRDQNGPSGLSR